MPFIDKAYGLGIGLKSLAGCVLRGERIGVMTPPDGVVVFCLVLSYMVELLLAVVLGFGSRQRGWPGWISWYEVWGGGGYYYVLYERMHCLTVVYITL